jgi:hypothetical protein
MTIKNAVFRDVTLCGSCKNRRFRGTITSIIKVVPISLNLVTLMMEAKRRFLQEPHGVTSKKTAFVKAEMLSYFSSSKKVG